MSKEFSYQIMKNMSEKLVELITRRMNLRINALDALTQSDPLDNHTPDVILRMREEEAMKLRAVIQEQSDLIEVIKMLFP